MEEKEITTSESSVNGNETDLLDALKKAKENSVSKEEYQKVLELNRQLINTVSEGRTIESVPEKAKVDIDALRDDVFNHEHTNIEYVSKMLELRSALIENGEEDPMLPSGTTIVPTDSDREAVEETVQVLNECIAAANGDSGLFTNELYRRLVDPIPAAMLRNTKK